MLPYPCRRPLRLPQHCLAPHGLSLAPQMLTALTHLPLLARSELPGKTCRFPTAHPLTPPPRGPAAHHKHPSCPLLRLEPDPVFKAQVDVTSPGKPCLGPASRRTPGASTYRERLCAWHVGSPAEMQPYGTHALWPLPCRPCAGSCRCTVLVRFAKTKTSNNRHFAKFISF